MSLFINKPQSIIRDKRLTDKEKDYLCLIAQLSQSKDCVASNHFFAEYFGVKRPSAVEVISSLKRKGFISTTERRRGGLTLERTITIVDLNSRNVLLPDSRELLPPDSRKSPSEVVGNSDFDSRKSPTQTIELTEELNNSRLMSNIKPEDVELWKKTYPHLNIEQQLSKMESWLDANPSRSPNSNYKRFVTNWLKREKISPIQARKEAFEDRLKRVIGE